MYESLMRPETRQYLREQYALAAQLRVLKPEEWPCSLATLVEVERHCELVGLPHEAWPNIARLAQSLPVRRWSDLLGAYSPR